MDKFNGFTLNRELATKIPPEFFSILLPSINDLFELKTVLYILWFIDNSENEFPYITLDQMEQDKVFLSSLGILEEDQKTNLAHSINLAVQDRILLEQKNTVNKGHHNIYFLNTQKGKEALELLNNGQLRIVLDDQSPVKLIKYHPNIFRLYEENIGIITPIIADSLKDLEENYPEEWIEQAFKEAVVSNVRKLRYIEAILKNWQEEGKNERTDRRRGQKGEKEHDPEQYIDGEFSDFIEH